MVTLLTAIAGPMAGGWRVLLASVCVLVLMCRGTTILVVLVVIVVSWTAIRACRCAVCRTSITS